MGPKISTNTSPVLILVIKFGTRMLAIDAMLRCIVQTVTIVLLDLCLNFIVYLVLHLDKFSGAGINVISPLAWM